MRLITRCPACATMFRVVPDQLRISDGWVRCGRCSEVFDARDHMQPVDPLGNLSIPPPQLQPFSSPSSSNPVVPAVDIEVALPVHAPEPAGALTGLSVPVPATPVSGREGSAAGARAGTQSPAPEPSDETDTWAQPLRPTTEPAVAELPAMANIGRDILELAATIKAGSRAAADPSTATSPPAVSPASATVEQPASEKPAERLAVSRVAEPDGAELEESLSFVRQARRKAFWSGRFVRTGLALLVLGLSGSLAAQMAFQYRDQLAAADARLKPWLERMCEPLNCTVGVPRQIESVVIEGSTFTKTRNRAYRLGFTLRNTASQAVATPALELTLTDSQDQPLVRRVLRPGEFGAAVALAPGTDWSGAIAFSDDLKTDGRVAGYRLLAFYP
ncbi:MAG: zinc-ribbon domain-containing protein [Burkholderiaceae bacterium]|nr:zinc-ribbon domain-containing protein [Burkholderiaceae bacterium]